MARTKIAAALLLAAIASASAGTARQGDAARGEQAPGEGVLCLWALTNVAAEVGRQCRAGANPAVQRALEDSVARFEAYVRRNTGTTDQQIDEFRRRQGLSGADAAQLCHGELLGAGAPGPGAVTSIGLGLWTRRSRSGGPTPGPAGHVRVRPAHLRAGCGWAGDGRA